MGSLGFDGKFLAVVILLSVTLSSSSAGEHNLFRLRPKAEGNALGVEVVHGENAVRLRGLLGMSHPTAAGSASACPDTLNCYQWGDYATVELKEGSSPSCGRVEWTSNFARSIEDCFDLEPGVHWYGGGETHTQLWPIEGNPRVESPFVGADFLLNTDRLYGGVVENYWLLSNGAFIFIEPGAPLHFSLNTTHRNRACFVARDYEPYTKRSPLTFSYEWCTAGNVKEAHQLALSLFIDKPESIPDETMLVRPLWSTWAEYRSEINQSMVLDYARRVVSEGFANSSHIEIDDNWESCYGQEAFDPRKFPDAKAMTDEIKGMGMRVTSWIVPYVNYECPVFQEGISNGYFVKDAKGKMGFSWWSNAGVVDMTNPDAVAWWTARLQNLKDVSGLDAFKFDYGESNHLPASHVLNGDPKLWPQYFSTKYVEASASLGGLIETRTAYRNQRLGKYVRMLDRDTRWGHDNGLRSLIPSLLHFSIVGYPFCLPDMVGGNGRPWESEKELYIRWLQVNIFMPGVQFSVVPWTFDAETVQITKDMLALRESHSEQILAAARQATVDGTPMNRPLWWVDPTDATTFTIDDEYMLGDGILVAPVTYQGAVARDIYLPTGVWTSGVDGREYNGPAWVNNYPAPLNVVPYFVKST